MKRKVPKWQGSKARRFRRTGKSNGHEWVQYEDLTFECCFQCGIIRRRDDKNSPCKGPVKVKPRDA